MISDNKPKLNDFMKIKLESDDDLALGIILNTPLCIITVKYVFQENYKYYPQVHLHVCFYEYEHEYEDDSYSII